MAKKFRPREVLKQAEDAERSGSTRVASKLFHVVALHLYRKNKWKEAYQVLDRAIGQSKKSARLYVLKAVLAHKLSMDQDRLEALKSFIDHSLESGKLVEYVTYLEDQMRELPNVRHLFFEELIKIERTSSFAFLGLARTCAEIGLFGRAKSVLLDALNLKDSHSKVIESLTSVLKACNGNHEVEYLEKYKRGEMNLRQLEALVKTGDEQKPVLSISDLEGEKDLKGLIDELERELGVSVDIDIDSVKPLVSEFRRRVNRVLGSDAKARIDIALAFYEMGLFDDANDELKNISGENPLFIEALSLQGKIFIEQGADLRALQSYQTILRQNEIGTESVKDALFHLVEIYTRMNDLKMALECANNLEILDPGYRDIRRIKINIRELSRR